MAIITGLTAERMEEIEAASIVEGSIVGDNLILEKHDGSTINAGNVRGPQGPTPSYVTTLPGAPTDLQEVYFQTTAMAALGIVWHAKYRQGTGKWDILGASPITATKGGGTTFAATAGAWSTPHADDLVELTTPPVSGDYYIEGSGQILSGNSVIGNYAVVLGANGSGSSPFNVGANFPANQYITQISRGIMSNVPASSLLRMRYYMSGATNLHIAGSFLAVTPIRIW